MVESKSSTGAPPPPYSSPTSQPRQIFGAPQDNGSGSEERTPLLYPTNIAVQSPYIYSYTTPQASTNTGNAQRQPQSTTLQEPQNPSLATNYSTTFSPNTPYTQEPQLPPPQTYYPHYNNHNSSPFHHRRPRPRSSSCRRLCRTSLLTLLGLAIIFTLFKTYFLFLPFHPPSLVLPLPDPHRAPLRVAVVGAGPAGVGVAWGLSASNIASSASSSSDQGHGGRKERKIDITVFEKKSQVGGKMLRSPNEGILTTTKFPALKPEDLASSSLFPPNSLIRQRAESILGLDFSTSSSNEKTTQVGFYTHKAIVAQLTRPISSLSWMTWASLLLRYGTSYLTAHNLSPSPSAMDTFLSLSSTAGKGKEGGMGYENITSWLTASSLLPASQKSAKDLLDEKGVSESYRNEITDAQLRRQFGQVSSEISSLALQLALGREDGPASASAVGGTGLQDVLEQFLTESGAKLKLGTEMTGMSKEMEWINGTEEPVWKLDFNTGESMIFDHVVLTMPWSENEKILRRKAWITFILAQGSLQGSTLGLDPQTALPEEILFVPGQQTGSWLGDIWSLSKVRDIGVADLGEKMVGTESVLGLWKILSGERIEKENLESLWEGGGVGIWGREDEGAWPLLFPSGWVEGSGEDKEGSFMVEEGWWRTGVVERVGCGADLSWAAGENVANLIRKNLD